MISCDERLKIVLKNMAFGVMVKLIPDRLALFELTYATDFR
jgi:hypothetical protein